MHSAPDTRPGASAPPKPIIDAAALPRWRLAQLDRLEEALDRRDIGHKLRCDLADWIAAERKQLGGAS